MVNKHVPALGPLHNPDDIAYLSKVENGIKYQVHFNAQDEFKEANKPFLPLLKEAGYKNIKFLPIIDEMETALRKRYFGKYWKGKKSPDVFADDVYVELKHAENKGRNTRRNIIAHIGKAAKKADEVIILSEKELDFKQIAEKQFVVHSNLKQITFFFKTKMFKFKRS